MKKTIYFIMMSWLMSSCYEDQGNYAYLPTNKITISGFNGKINDPLFIQLQREDSVKLRPDILFEKENHSQHLKYEWISGGELISEEDSLVYPVKNLKELREGINLKPFIKLVVTNEASGDIAMRGCYVEVEPPKGWVVLTKQTNGEHNLHYLYPRWLGENEDSLRIEANIKIYEHLNPEEKLGKDVLKIRSHYTARPQSYDNILVIKSDEPYTIDINGETFTKDLNTYKMFTAGNIPENYSPIDECAVANSWASSSYIVNHDGNVFVRTKNTPSEHHSGVYTTDAYHVDEKGMKATRIWDSSSGHACAWIYDDLNKRLLVGTAGMGGYSGDEAAGIAIFPENDTNGSDLYLNAPEDFPKLHDLKGEILHVGSTGQWGHNVVVMLYRTELGELQLLRFYLQMSQAQNTLRIYSNNMRDFELHSLNKDLFHEESQFVQPLHNQDVFFFTGGPDNQTLYVYEFNTGRGAVEYEVFNSPIASMASDIKKGEGYSNVDYSLAVGLKNGQLKVININPEIVSDDTQKGKRELASYDFEDEIVDVIYKFGFMYYAW